MYREALLAVHAILCVCCGIPSPSLLFLPKDNHNYYTSNFMPGDGNSYWFDLPQLYARNDSQVVLSSLSGRSKTIQVNAYNFACACAASYVCIVCITLHIIRLYLFCLVVVVVMPTGGSMVLF